ncbi:uncharacterized protein LOC135103243 [Scylla paramamosain]|uniref:uncharacterized protein LOC135103243 n=1 Tax=Scylla paramamosain TaxID=85552 RepID=UPI003082B729
MAVRRLLPLVVYLVCYVTVTGGRGDGRKDGGGAGGEGGGAAAQIRNIFGVATEEGWLPGNEPYVLTPQHHTTPQPTTTLHHTTNTTTTHHTTPHHTTTPRYPWHPDLPRPAKQFRPPPRPTAAKWLLHSLPHAACTPQDQGRPDYGGRCGLLNAPTLPPPPPLSPVTPPPRNPSPTSSPSAPRSLYPRPPPRDPSKFPLHVSIGEQRALPRRTVRVTHALYHSDFGKTSTFDSDLGVLLLEERIDPFPATPCLPEMDREVPEGVAVTVVGWGATSEDGNISSVLKEAELDVLPKGSCIDAYSSNFNPNKMICAGKLNGAADACQGDSGGPLIQRGEREEEEEKAVWVVVGVVSFGNGCGRPGFPGAYTRTSAFLPWLKKVLLLYP